MFIWSDQFRTGNEKIDKQHQRLVQIINNLGESLQIGAENNVRLGLLNDLVEYTRYHFSYEEQFMQEHHYAEEDLQNHLKIHQQFVDKILQAQQDYLLQPEKVSDDLLDFLVDWLTNHILRMDKNMIAALANNTFSMPPPTSPLDIVQHNLYGALRESEARFRELADLLPALIWISNSENQRIYSNRYWFNLCNQQAGLKSNKQWTEFIHPDDRNRLISTYEEAFATHNTVKIEYRVLMNEAAICWILETATPRIRKNGQFSGFMGCGIDISRQKQISAELELSVERLEETVLNRTLELQRTNQKLYAEKEEQLALNQQLKEAQGHLLQSEKMASIGQFAAGVAHEINNPLDYIYSNLNTLKGYLPDLLQFAVIAEKLAAQLPDENPEVQTLQQFKQKVDLAFLQDDMSDLVSESIEGATRAKKIVQNLRDFSRIDKPQREIFDLEKGIDATLNIAHNELKYKAEIVREYASIEPFECVGDQLNQVFMNLLINAAQAIEEFGKIFIRTGKQGDHWIWVEIEDTGKGIPENIKSRIYNPFFTTKPAGKGTGLRLSLSYKIIQDHHGRIELDSTLGKGTKFRIYLPVEAEFSGLIEA